MIKFVKNIAFLAFLMENALGGSQFMCINSETNLRQLLGYTDMKECVVKSYCTCAEMLTTCVFGPDENGKFKTEQVTKSTAD